MQKNLLPPGAEKLLGLGKNFIPAPPWTTGAKEMATNMHRFKRDLSLKIHFSYEGEIDDIDDPRINSKLYLKSDWEPDTIKGEVLARLEKFFNELSSHFIRRKTAPENMNLTAEEQAMLKSIAGDDMTVIATADKGLGPCEVSVERYGKDGLKHIEDESTYEILSEAEAWKEVRQLKIDIMAWLDQYQPYQKHEKRGTRPGAGALKRKQVQYIRFKTNDSMKTDPFAYFYLMYKIHKPTLSTRPVSSQSGSVSYAIAQYVDEVLQPIAKDQLAYFQDSFALKKMLNEIKLPAGASLFSMDAVSMYTSIDSEACLTILSEFLRKRENIVKYDYNADCIIEALAIVLRSNVMKFGDLFVKQIKGVAMGICPAPPIANLFYAIKELDLIPRWQSLIPFYVRFIDDVFGIWVHDRDPERDMQLWNDFQNDVNQHHGLQWTFTERSRSVVFMDMTIYMDRSRIATDLYEKPMCLFLYLPYHSSHPPGVLNSLIFGQTLRIFTLCTEESQMKRHLTNFYRRLIDRGYTREQLQPLFERAVDNAESYMLQTDEEKRAKKKAKMDATKRKVFFHVPWHPNNPSASVLQQLFRDCISHPVGQPPLCELRNHERQKIQVDGMVVCYHRHKNLGNVLSYRKIDNKGLKVSDLRSK